MKLAQSLASLFLALLLPTQVTPQPTDKPTSEPTSKQANPRTPQPTSKPTDEPTPMPCPAGQIETWADLVDEVAESKGDSDNPTIITLCPGTFTVDGGVDLGGKYVEIKCGGTGTTKECVIDGSCDNCDTDFGFYAAGAFSVLLEGLTFKNFYGNGSPAVDISSENGFLAMKECTFTSNSYGGVRFVGGTLDIQDCLFESNGSSATAAVWVGDGSGATAVATISNSVFKDNTGNDNGGAVGCRGSNVNCHVTSSTFTGNQASGTPGGGSGGAVWCGNQATCSISGSTFLNNNAANGDNIYCTDDSAGCYVDQCSNVIYERGVSY